MAKNGTTAAVMRAIKTFREREGYSPSYRDIMGATGISSTSVVAYHILKLERAGAIRRTPRAARSYVVVEGNDGTKDMSILWQ